MRFATPHMAQRMMTTPHRLKPISKKVQRGFEDESEPKDSMCNTMWQKVPARYNKQTTKWNVNMVFTPV